MRLLSLSLGIVFVASLALAQTAQAFSIDTHTNQSTDGSTRIQNPDGAFQGGGSSTSTNDSGLHVYFGGSNNNTNNTPTSAQSMFLPSGNRQMQSPWTSR